MKHEKSDPYDPLLDDDTFVDLMEAEYQHQNQPEDALEKQKIWNALEKKTKPRNLSRTWIPLAAVATLLITLVPNLFFSTTDDISRVKGNPSLIDTSLQTYLINENGELEVISAKVKVGDTIVFKTHIEAEGIIAFGYSKNHLEPKIRFVTQRTAPGKLNFLKREGRTFGYSVEAGDKDLRFCTIAAENIKLLQKTINNLTNVWSTLSEGSCITITTQ